jgi:predicted DsbA family dithiol-disulfide isomerase
VAELARENGVHEQLHARLMTGYWAEDLDISDPDVLAQEGEAVGLDRERVIEVATTFTYQDRIDASTRAVHEMGANGVPAFVVDDRILIPGAQPHELFEKVMQRFEHESVDPTDDSLTEGS